MPTDIQTILDAAEKLSLMVADHPAVARYKAAQKSVADDPEAGRMLAEFDRQIETLGRQEQQGVPVSEAQRTALEALQSRIISHLKIKNLNMAQVEFIDLLRKVNQTIQKPLTESAGAGAAGGPVLSRG
jgi:cell fate (sporulation/competence/biofilm development) regulator YlbF (YheA/YmcA/DUF963 family)